MLISQETRVLSSNGYVNDKRILCNKLTKFIIGDSNKNYDVKCKQDSSVVFKTIHFTNHRSVSLSNESKVCVLRNKSYNWIKVSELVEGDTIRSDFSNVFPSDIKKILSSTDYEQGVFLALDNKRYYSSKIEIDQTNPLVEILHKRHKSRYRITNANKVEFGYKFSFSFQLPSELTPYQKIEILKGIVDTKGCLTNKGIELRELSNKLQDDLKDLLHSLGINTITTVDKLIIPKDGYFKLISVYGFIPYLTPLVNGSLSKSFTQYKISKIGELSMKDLLEVKSYSNQKVELIIDGLYVKE